MTTVNYTPIFYTDTSSFNYFDVFMENVVFKSNPKRTIRYFFVLIALFWLVVVFCRIQFNREYKMSSLIKSNSATKSNQDNTNISIFKESLLPYLTSELWCEGEVLRSSSGNTLAIGYTCPSFLELLNKQ